MRSPVARGISVTIPCVVRVADLKRGGRMAVQSRRYSVGSTVCYLSCAREVMDGEVWSVPMGLHTDSTMDYLDMCIWSEVSASRIPRLSTRAASHLLKVVILSRASAREQRELCMTQRAKLTTVTCCVAVQGEGLNSSYLRGMSV